MGLVLLLLGIMSLIAGLVLTFAVGVVNTGIAGIVIGVILLVIADRADKASTGPAH